MDWITGIQRAIDYIEAHITEDIDYEQVARESFSSSCHFQRVFSILCGYTLGEYIRNRRLTLAGIEIASGTARIIDIAGKYGYESPDSFTKAFQRFHGIVPSQARGGAPLRSFSRLSIHISLEGGSMMNYRMEQKPEMVLTGFKRRFRGTPADRAWQDHEFACETRLNQYILQGAAHDCDTVYEVVTDIGDDGYDFYIAARLDPVCREDFEESLGPEAASRFTHLSIPAGTYLICETARCEFPTNQIEDLRRQAVSQWLPSSGYELAGTPEVDVIHWFWKYGDEAVNHSRYAELWLPIVKATP